MESKSKSDIERTGDESALEGDHNIRQTEKTEGQNEGQNDSNDRFNLHTIHESIQEIDSNTIENNVNEQTEGPVEEPTEGPAEEQVEYNEENMSGQNEETDSYKEEVLINHWCDLCKKVIAFDDIEPHLIECTSKAYNEDVLTADIGECLICLDDLKAEQMIARLPCLCVYHIDCIKGWFRVVRACPQHPKD